MTPQEKIDLLENMKEIQKLNEQKTDITLETIMLAKQLAAENLALIQENAQLKRALEIAEKQILRDSEGRGTWDEQHGVWDPARSVVESIKNGWSGA